MVLKRSLHKNIKLMLEFPRVPFLVLHRLLLLYINDLPDDVICDIYVNDTTLYSKCDEASDQN